MIDRKWLIVLGVSQLVGLLLAAKLAVLKVDGFGWWILVCVIAAGLCWTFVVWVWTEDE